mmetsp:Transcript_1150/g.2724  ORF Transcript_1150/g.2724 Transcript_1150/m.2724 type:complete len:159 (+) Transcript_1150:101-577(+)|eukprot:CAMPEP_0119570292 /NCGR_PEP_ID=MMETSP1352-20130426/43536_1 /TAXON_ID=265584 /ORGANISM="Stauroneis constricta, Strain CCMP1120" /LENGTH=158 /DNA_ID=CAMNT_0007619959 /DNA_START=568 /DNA_END=1044 /DNA_ORIENTATION=-
MVRFVTLAVLMATAANAFTVPPPAFNNRVAVAPTTTAQNVIMTEEETRVILSKAEECVESECTVTDVANLIHELKDTEKELNARMEKVMNMIASLQNLNDKKARKKEDVRQFVSDMLRVFNTDKPFAFPAGFSGDIGDGPTTAYDALPPKPWKASDKQ